MQAKERLEGAQIATVRISEKIRRYGFGGLGCGTLGVVSYLLPCRSCFGLENMATEFTLPTACFVIGEGGLTCVLCPLSVERLVRIWVLKGGLRWVEHAGRQVDK